MHKTIFSAILVLILLAAPLAALAAPLRLAVVTKPGSAQNFCAEYFARLLDRESHGSLATKVFHSGAMGDETQILTKVRSGELELCVVTTGPFDSLAPQARAVEYPFLFESFKQVDRVLQGPAGRKLLASLDGAGFQGLAFAENGFRNLTNNLRPIKRAADLKGLRIRVMESELQTALWRDLGAVPLPHPWPINNLLASGKVDGQENPLGVIWKYRLDKVQKYLSLTRHVYSAHICAANPAWFQALPPADRKLVAECMTQAAALQRADNRRQVAAYLAKLKKAGMQVVEKPDRASFQKLAAPIASSPLFAAPQVAATLQTFKQALRP
ncbi:MAG: DctP family TRAP transporter solute-binding subunit [Desulfarculaceae bacterium]|nr:DctP family TRAP transporter solute-binding subunit [Desulfarculaceae bacterium]MCF8072000.1 DctP family TRAP transporter solute-binding subunit [Desulfarculaceae bacterium]MCF8101517.1 DctP family TRAP transporter solute-binding subunit [Desulfarculaceae bacterium]MCF8115067.1 DctP family TRAP transporter solute-binding subunit [Desulfarculaceae bacterium]